MGNACEKEAVKRHFSNSGLFELQQQKQIAFSFDCFDAYSGNLFCMLAFMVKMIIHVSLYLKSCSAITEGEFVKNHQHNLILSFSPNKNLVDLTWWWVRVEGSHRSHANEVGSCIILDLIISEASGNIQQMVQIGQKYISNIEVNIDEYILYKLICLYHFTTWVDLNRLYILVDPKPL